MEVKTQDVKALIQQCARGETAARIAFQEEYGPLIYSFPVRIFHLSEGEAGAFYLYAFEKDRIFKRMQTFQGRNAIQFTTYLSFHVLHDLLLEWLRTREDPEVLSLDTPTTHSMMEHNTPLGQRLASEVTTPEHVLLEAEELHEAVRLLEGLDPEKRLLLKILCLAEVDLELGEIRLIAQLSGRGISEIVQTLEEIQTALGQRADKSRQRQEKLAAVSAWIITYQQKLRQLEEELSQNVQQDSSAKIRGLQKEREEWERKLAWRYRQQEALRREATGVHIRPSYKDIARLLNWPLGTVCSKIARAREELWQAMMESPPRGPITGG